MFIRNGRRDFVHVVSYWSMWSKRPFSLTRIAHGASRWYEFLEKLEVYKTSRLDEGWVAW